MPVTLALEFLRTPAVQLWKSPKSRGGDELHRLRRAVSKSEVSPRPCNAFRTLPSTLSVQYTCLNTADVISLESAARHICHITSK